MAAKINASKGAACAEYFSLSKATKVANVSMEKDGKKSGNEHLKSALKLVGKEKFDLSCVTAVDDRLYMGYCDYADTLAVKDGKGVIYTEEVRVNRNGEEYTVHCVEFDEEEDCVGYYEGTQFVANESQWDGRMWRAAKDIEGLKRYTPKDCVKAFFAKFAAPIREYNNRLDAERAAAKAANEQKKADKKRKEEDAARKEHARMLEVLGISEADYQALMMKRGLDAIGTASMSAAM